MKPSWKLEDKLYRAGFLRLAGIDEAGRGALAGPVVAAVVSLAKRDYRYRDSKTLSFKQRAEMAAEIKDTALNWAVGFATAGEIDKINVLAATHLAAKRALYSFKQSYPVDAVVTDYLHLQIDCEVLAVAKADSLSYQVAAAGIIAKDTRDRHMIELDKLYPDYGFARHKGYATRLHKKAIAAFGPSAIHRLSYKPLAQVSLFD